MTDAADPLPQAPSARPWAAREAAAVGALALLAALFAFRPAYSVDLFWLLRLGQVIWETGSIPHTDLFSAVHPDAAWVHFQWGWELLAFLVVHALGFTALRALNALAVALAFVGLYAVLRGHLARTVAGALTALGFVLFEDRLQLRPDIANFALWVPLLPVLLRLTAMRPGRGARDALFVGGLAWVWSNLHGGGVLLLLLLLGAAAVGALWDARRMGEARPVARSAAWLVLAAGLGAVLNPAFIPGLVHFADIFRPMIGSGNEEWQPSYTIVAYGLHPNFVLVALAPVVGGLAWVARAMWVKPRPSGVEVLTALVCIALSNAFVRAAFLAVYPLALACRASAPVERPSLRVRAPLAPAVAVTGLVAMVGIAVDYNAYRPRGGMARTLEMATFDLEPKAFPEEAGRFLAESGIEGGILNEGKWAGYILWSCWPACRVFADSRHHLTEEMWLAFRAMHDPIARSSALSRIAARYDLHLALFSGPTFPLLVPPPDWQLIFKAGPQEVYVRSGGPDAARNRDRAVAWLQEHGAPLPAHPTPVALAASAIEVGARQWLASPWNQLVWRDAAEEMSSAEPRVRARGLRRRASTLFEAGLYEAAIGEYEASLALDAHHPRAWLRVALAQFAMGNHTRARQALSHLGDAAQSLSEAEHRQANMLHQALAASSGGGQR